MKKLIYLFILAIGFTSCSVESIDSTENLLTADLKAPKISVAYAGPGEGAFVNNGGKTFGYIFVTNDCENIYIEFAPTGTDDIEEVKMGVFANGGLPTLNGGGNANVDSEFPYNLDNGPELKWVIPYSAGTTSVNIFATAWGHGAGDKITGKEKYLTYVIEEVICDEPVCESGYMIGDNSFSGIGTSNNWGWAHKFEFGDSGSETREIHHKNGSLGGTVTVSFDNGEISVAEGTGVNITHLYISNDEPTDNAPGQFGVDSYKDEDGTFWVMIKAEVCK